MPTQQSSFRVSSGLKDLIGRDLITDEFVAVFELVKNAFDAHAGTVRVLFEPDRIVITDDGKGMSRRDITDKFLFVAYSAKRDGTEDDDYRDRISGRGRPFAGAKGVGRFSCDRLGAELALRSRARGGKVEVLDIDWRLYEGDARIEFGDIPVRLSEEADFPEAAVRPKGRTGTVLEIRSLRSDWDRPKLQALKRDLTKLIDPFATGAPKFSVVIVAPGQVEADRADGEFNATMRDGQQPRTLVNGPIENPILEVVGQRTTVIRVRLIDSGRVIQTTLEDRGKTVYRIKEENKYPLLVSSNASADVYYLNRRSKAVFALRMGVPAVQFGSILLFRNGFRVVPIGAQDDDFFRLNQRKQQGQRRFLGGRDLIGHVDIAGAPGFDETTSRNGGLILTPEVAQLIEFVRDKCVRRLERYVIDISWLDRFDKDVEDTSRMELDESSARISQLVSRLAATEGVELLEYDPGLVRLLNEKSASFETSLKAMELLADEKNDPRLLALVDAAKARMKALEEAEAESREAERRAEERAQAAERSATAADVRYAEERERNDFLVAVGSMDEDTILNLHHQIIMYASNVHLEVKRTLGRLREGDRIQTEEWVDLLGGISFQNSQILTAARFATKGGYKKQSSVIEADLAVYVRDYIETVSALWAPRGFRVSVHSDGKPAKRKFRPIEVGIVVDNLVGNSVKAHATSMVFDLRMTPGAKRNLEIIVADDGNGWPASIVPVGRVFDKGVTTTDGSGLGLHHVRRIVEEMGGVVEARAAEAGEELDGARLKLSLPI